MARHRKQHREPIEPKSWPKRAWNRRDIRYQKPLTAQQTNMFEAFEDGNHVIAYGTAGTGKTFIALYLALIEMLAPDQPVSNIVIIRSAVQGREIGHMPGTLEEKIAVYEAPYRDILHELTGSPSAYDDMKSSGLIRFASTSFLRGLTYSNSIVIVDEGQNLAFHEINSIMTRIGENSTLFFLGDVAQDDLRKDSGMERFLRIASTMRDMAMIRFTREDIVRSDFVRSWIISCEENP